MNLVILEKLIEMFPHESDGAISRRRAHLVSHETRDQVTRALYGGAAPCNAAPCSISIASTIGALYSGSQATPHNIDACRSFITKYWDVHLQAERLRNGPLVDSKTALQEWAQLHKLPAPVYEEVSRTGPDHDLVLHVRVQMRVHPTASNDAHSPHHTYGEGRTKKEAEKAAATAMLAHLQSLKIVSLQKLRGTMSPLSNGFIFAH